MTLPAETTVFGVIEIEYWQLVLATLFILVSAGLSLAFSLGFIRSLLVATLRTYLQLFALGFVLRWVFSINTPLLILALLTVMVVMGAFIALNRTNIKLPGMFPLVLNAVFLSCVTVTFAVTALIVRVEPWYEARYLIPIAGMVVGNSMTGLSLGLERLFSDLKKRGDEINLSLALGATPWEASLPSIRAALYTALIPTINSMSAVGIVFIPGMMTGQILAGVDPSTAASYQIVVMLMISAATAIGAVLAVITTYGKAFDEFSCFVLPDRDGDP